MSLKSADALVNAGLIPFARAHHVQRVAGRYALSLTAPMAALIDPADKNDPIAQQFIPDMQELIVHADELADPIGDRAHSPCEGLVHRYPDRVLLKLANICPVYCRFCFRRAMIGPGKSEALSDEALTRAIAYIRNNPSVWEVIITGGDPLVLSPRRIRALAALIEPIPHVKILRWHSRVPAVEPSLITEAMVRALRSLEKTTYIVLHANHPRELTPNAAMACAMLIDGGIPMLSQTVLLKGVNDDVGTLAELMRAFVALRIKPYYLHHPDKAPGTAHFRVSIEKGQALMRDLRARVSGLCMPLYVLDIPGGHGKVPVGPVYATATDSGSYTIMDEAGDAHNYPD